MWNLTKEEDRIIGRESLPIQDKPGLNLPTITRGRILEKNI